jgi:CheY-like chemotaxis protein
MAIEVAKEFRPDLVLMDLGMPGMSGFEAAKHIRAQSWGKAMKLVALSGWGQPEHKIRTREAGFDLHMVKPPKLEDLKRLLAEGGNGSG